VTFFVVWRAKAQRRKEIRENLSDLPEAGRLFVNLFFIWREEAQRRKEKTPLRLRVFAR
jgi:preprotein translocase subunit YajC